MKNLKLFFSPFILGCVVSCQQKQPDFKERVNKFADLECRAIGLREKRFALADRIRFTKDSLFQLTNKADTSTLHLKLETYNQDKEVMLQQSVSLADTIKNELNDRHETLAAFYKVEYNYKGSLLSYQEGISLANGSNIDSLMISI